jgi:hypothetical protein
LALSDGAIDQGDRLVPGDAYAEEDDRSGR